MSVSYGFYRHEGDVHGPRHLPEFYASLLPPWLLSAPELHPFFHGGFM
jgi:hypothetical protein